MKIKAILSLVVVCAAFALCLPPELSAQTISNRRVVPSSSVADPSAASEAHGNLVLCLNIVPKNKEAEGQESIRVLLVADEEALDFNIQHIRMQGEDPVILVFRGQLVQLADKTYTLDYTLSQSLPIVSGNNRQYRDCGWAARIEVKKNEKVVLMEDSTIAYELSLSDAPPPKPVED
jgi:hypothetical protein